MTLGSRKLHGTSLDGSSAHGTCSLKAHATCNPGWAAYLKGMFNVPRLMGRCSLKDSPESRPWLAPLLEQMTFRNDSEGRACMQRREKNAECSLNG